MKTYPLPLLPLEIVICPKGLVPIKILEDQYLDMVKVCLRDKTPFGIVTSISQKESFLKRSFPFFDIATSVEIIEIDEKLADSLSIRCSATHRIKIHSFDKQKNGLLVGHVSDISNDLRMAIPEDLQFTSAILNELLNSVSSVKASIPPPYELDSASWVSNRWTELLNLPLLDKQRLMQQESPIVRLELIQDLLQQGSHILNSSLRN